MNRRSPKMLRRRFLVTLGHAIHVTWPVLSVLLAIQLALGLLTGFLEGWPLGDAIYFTFITGLTIGYGDLVLPKEWRLLGPIEGFTGILMFGLSTAFFFIVVSKRILQRMDEGRRN